MKNTFLLLFLTAFIAGVARGEKNLEGNIFSKLIFFVLYYKYIDII